MRASGIDNNAMNERSDTKRRTVICTPRDKPRAAIDDEIVCHDSKIFLQATEQVFFAIVASCRLSKLSESIFHCFNALSNGE